MWNKAIGKENRESGASHVKHLFLRKMFSVTELQLTVWQANVQIAGAPKCSLDSNSFTYSPWWDDECLSGSGWDGQSTEISHRKAAPKPLQQPCCLVSAMEEGGESTATHHVLGDHMNIPPGPARGRGSGQSPVVGQGCRAGLAGGFSLHGHGGFTAALSTWKREGGRTVWMCNTLVHTAEEITADQSTCLFKAADLPVGDSHSSSTLKTAASVKQNSTENAIPGAPPCCPRQLFAVKQHIFLLYLLLTSLRSKYTNPHGRL